METTTGQYQKKPDYYGNAEDCQNSEKTKVNTNPRYKFFNQTHFTAGDVEQFERYRDASNGQICLPNVTLENNLFRGLIQISFWEKYQNLNALSVSNTFNYLFHKFKKGIFIKIKNGQLRVFLPFSNKNFVNEWSRQIQIDPSYRNSEEFIRHIANMENRRFFTGTVNKFVDTWYANNCLVRYEFPIQEGDTNVPVTSDMFRVLCQEREIPDIEFFVNRRDFPILKRDETEPYDHLYNSDKIPLLSQNYDSYAPIFSMVGAENFADIPIPTGDDWARVTREEGKYFARTCQRDFDVIPNDWHERKSTAVFRGASTGCGVTIETNQRLKLAYLSQITPHDEDGLPLLDAGITSWNLRPRKLKNENYLQSIEIQSLPFSLAPWLSFQEQRMYKYIVNVDGHVSAFRLSLELAAGFCVLLVDSKYHLWFKSLLKPWVHFVPIDANLSNLITRIKWCKKHDEKCRQIANRAKEFADKYLSKNGILDYLQNLLCTLKKINGIYLYNSLSLLEIQHKNECDFITHSRSYPENDKTLADLVSLPIEERNFGLLQGTEWIVSKILTEGDFTQYAEEKEKIFTSSSTIVKRYEIAGYSVIRKECQNMEKYIEFVHEFFVAKKEVNNLLKQVPNFSYIFGLYKQDNTISIIAENINGPTLSEYIHSPFFQIKDFVLILVQLALALHTGQKNCALVHNDLTPWNIVVQQLKEETYFDYIVSYNKIYRVKASLIPIIIDLGKAHIIHDKNHYGTTAMFTVSTIHDIVTILATTLYEISGLKNISSQMTTVVLLLANFLSCTGYHEKKFFAAGKDGLGEIRYFFRRAKKYSELMTREKYELEKKTPLDFVEYILSRVNLNLPVEKVKTLIFHLNKGNARQVYDYSFCSTIQTRAKTYSDIFKRVKKCILPETENIFLIHYTVKILLENMFSVYNTMMQYLINNKIDIEKYVKKYKDAVEHICQQYFDSDLRKNPIEYKIDKIISLSKISYNEETFLFAEKVLQILRSFSSLQIKTVPGDITVYCAIVERALIPSVNISINLDKQNRAYYLKNFHTLLQLNQVEIKTKVANLVSFLNTSSLLYSHNLTSIEERLSLEKGDCTQAFYYLRLFREILAFLNS